MELYMRTAQIGRVWVLINNSCCTCIDQSGQIAMAIHTIWQHAKLLPEVIKDDTSWSKHLWKILTS